MEKGMTELTRVGVESSMLFNIYLALFDAYERLDDGCMNMKRCLDYLEAEHGYKPLPGYIIKDVKIELDIRKRESELKDRTQFKL